jgi:hypothetical protein
MRRSQVICAIILAFGQSVLGESHPTMSKPASKSVATPPDSRPREFGFGGAMLTFGTAKQDVLDTLQKEGLRTLHDEKLDQWIAYSAETDAAVGTLRFEQGKLISVTKFWYFGADARVALSRFYDACSSAEVAEVHPDNRFFVKAAQEEPTSHLKSINLSYEHHTVSLQFGDRDGIYSIEVTEHISSWY